MRRRVLLGQLASNGDCLYATTIARQIKTDFPGCHLTWAISSRCRSMIEGNPDVDEVWEVAPRDDFDIIQEWQHFEAEAKGRSDFDELFLLQISPSTYHLWTGSVRSAIFRAYRRPITVDIAPVLRLSSEEVEEVARFAQTHRLSEKSHVILFECAPKSQQSPVNLGFALEVAQRVVETNPNVALVLSSNHAFSSTHPGIIDGSVLSLRQNAELTKHCSLLVGCSSGVTWIATSEWAKPLPTLQLVRPDKALSNSLVADFEIQGRDTSLVIEMNRYSSEDVLLCLDDILADKFSSAKSKYHQATPLKFDLYKHLQTFLVARFQWKECLGLLRLNINDHGFRPQFFSILSLVLSKRFIAGVRKAAFRLKRFSGR